MISLWGLRPQTHPGLRPWTPLKISVLRLLTVAPNKNFVAPRLCIDRRKQTKYKVESKPVFMRIWSSRLSGDVGLAIGRIHCRLCNVRLCGELSTVGSYRGLWRPWVPIHTTMQSRYSINSGERESRPFLEELGLYVPVFICTN